MKKIFSLLLIFSLMLGLLTGCGDSSSSDKSTSSDQLTVLWDSSAFLYDFDSLGSVIDKTKQDITSGTTKDTPLIQSQIANTELIAGWAKEKGIDIKCNAWGWADSLTSKLNAAFLAKDGPDLIIGETQMPKYATDGNLVAFPDDLAKYIRENCSPVAYKDMEIDGKIYGLTLAPSMTILVWNKDILKKTKSYGPGTSVYEKGPKDWAEWESVMKEIDALKSQQIYAGGVYCAGNYGGYLRVGALMNGAGGGFADEGGKPKINTKENQEAFSFIRRMNTHTLAGTLNTPQDADYFAAFNRGNLAYIMDGVWAVHNAGTLDFECGFSLIPGKEEGQVSNMLIGAGYMAVPSYSKNQELAFELLRRMLESDIQQNLANGGLRAPVLKSIVQSDEYKEKQPLLYEFSKYALENELRGLPRFKGNQIDLWAAVGVAVNSAATTESPLGGVLETAQQKMSEAYNK